jgi:hypothetical protein
MFEDVVDVADGKGEIGGHRWVGRELEGWKKDDGGSADGRQGLGAAALGEFGGHVGWYPLKVLVLSRLGAGSIGRSCEDRF